MVQTLLMRWLEINLKKKGGEKMRRLILFLCAIVLVFGTAGSQALATAINYSPDLEPPAPVLGAGWAYDQINAAFADSIDSPYIFNLSSDAVFRITDDFIKGDVYYVYDFGALILTTTFYTGGLLPPPSGYGDSAWYNIIYSKGEVTLQSGNHQLTVQGNGAGGIPAGFYTRIDAVPEPSTFLLISAGLAGVGLLRRRLKN